MNSKAILFAALAGLCWGIGEVLGKQVLSSRQVGPFALVLARAAGAVPLALLAFYLAAHTFRAEPATWWRADGPVLWKLLLGPVLMAGFGGVLFFYLGLRYGDISVVKPISFVLAPLFAVLLGWLLLREPMSPQKGLGVALGLVGVVLIATSPHAGPASAPVPAAQR